MPEPRPSSFPAKFLPRPRQALRITFAPPIDTTHIASLLASANPPNSASSPSSSVSHTYSIASGVIDPAGSDGVNTDFSIASAGEKPIEGERRKGPLAIAGLDYGAYGETPAKRWVRSALTAAVQREVEKVGYAVEGALLGRPTLPELRPEGELEER